MSCQIPVRASGFEGDAVAWIEAENTRRTTRLSYSPEGYEGACGCDTCRSAEER